MNWDAHLETPSRRVAPLLGVECEHELANKNAQAADYLRSNQRQEGQNNDSTGLCRIVSYLRVFFVDRPDMAFAFFFGNTVFPARVLEKCSLTLAAS